MRFYFTIGENAYAPFKIFGLQGPSEDKFTELRKFLADTAAIKLEELQSNFAPCLSLVVAAVLMLITFLITGCTLMKIVRCLFGTGRIFSARRKSYKRNKKAADFETFNLPPEIFDFVDEFPNDLPLITSEDVRKLCSRTPALKPLTEKELLEVERWLRTL